MVFQPSPDLQVWSDGLAEGWQKLHQASDLMDQGDGAKAAELVGEAFKREPSLIFAYQWARVLARSEQDAEAIEVLESALAASGRDDWEFRMRSHDLLGQLLVRQKRADEARAHFRIVRDNSYRTELLERAEKFLSSGS